MKEKGNEGHQNCKKCSLECKFFWKLANTEETGQGVCGWPQSFFPTAIGNDCVFIPKPYTCGDCSWFGSDACYTAEATDSIYRKDGRQCCGFVDKKEDEMLDIMSEWSRRGFDVSKKVKDLLKQFKEEEEARHRREN